LSVGCTCAWLRRLPVTEMHFRHFSREFFLLCRANTYCLESQLFSCPHNSRSLQHGAYDVKSCTCVPGFFMENSECLKYPGSFFCNLNSIHQCPLNMHTTIDTPGSIANCVCLPGFSQKSTSDGCEAITIGKEALQGVKISAVKNCPPETTTQNTQSIHKVNMVVAHMGANGISLATNRWGGACGKGRGFRQQPKVL